MQRQRGALSERDGLLIDAWDGEDLNNRSAAFFASHASLSPSRCRNQTADRWVWRPAKCALRPVNSSRMCAALRGHALLFAGDSLSFQSFESLHYALGDNPHILSGSLQHVGGASVVVCDGAVRLTYVLSDTLDTTVAAARGPGRLVTTLAAKGQTPNRTVRVVNHATARDNAFLPLLPDHTILVVSTGAHYHPTAHVASRLTRLATAVIPFLRSPGRSALQYVVWRPALPGHPNCTAHMQPLNSTDGWLWDADRAHASSWHWSDIAEQIDPIEATVRAVFPPSALRVLDTRPLLLRADRHVGANQVDSPMADCLHYCLPGPPDLATVLLHHMLVEPGWMPLRLQAPLMSKRWARPEVLTKKAVAAANLGCAELAGFLEDCGRVVSRV